jgi:hypothetical protein
MFIRKENIMEITKELVEAMGFVKVKNSNNSMLWEKKWFDPAIKCHPMNMYGKMKVYVRFFTSNSQWNIRVTLNGKTDTTKNLRSIDDLVYILAHSTYASGMFHNAMRTKAAIDKYT